MDLIMVLGGPYLDTELPQPFSFEPAILTRHRHPTYQPGIPG
jgi:hypothetical protein